MKNNMLIATDFGSGSGWVFSPSGSEAPTEFGRKMSTFFLFIWDKVLEEAGNPLSKSNFIKLVQRMQRKVIFGFCENIDVLKLAHPDILLIYPDWN